MQQDYKKQSITNIMETIRKGKVDYVYKEDVLEVLKEKCEKENIKIIVTKKDFYYEVKKYE